MNREIEKIERTCRIGSVKYVVSIEPREISVEVYTYPTDEDTTNYAVNSWTVTWPKRSSYAQVVHSQWNTEWGSGPEWYQPPSIASDYFRLIAAGTAKRLQKLTDNDPALQGIARSVVEALGEVFREKVE